MLRKDKKPRNKNSFDMFRYLMILAIRLSFI